MKKNILFIGAHIDDVELGCGGAMFSAQKRKDNIIYVSFSNCQNLARNKTLLDEYTESIKFIKPHLVFKFDFDNTRMPSVENREKIRKVLEDIRDKYEISQVFTHWLEDINQDHRAVAEETVRVFRYSSIFMYEIPHSCPSFAPNFYIPFSDGIANLYLALCNIYKSQRGVGYYNQDAIEGTIRFRGLQVGKKYAQAFRIWRGVDEQSE